MQIHVEMKIKSNRELGTLFINDKYELSIEIFFNFRLVYDWKFRKYFGFLPTQTQIWLKYTDFTEPKVTDGLALLFS